MHESVKERSVLSFALSISSYVLHLIIISVLQDCVKKFKKIMNLATQWISITAGGCVVAKICHYFKVERKKTDKTPRVIEVTHSSWDSNWDKRDISSVLKVSTNPQDNKKHKEKKKKLVPTAKRHIFLIRHGQYNQWRDDEKGRRLTDLGIEQSMLVGKRLKDLDLNFTKIIHSTLIRAVETAEQIAKFFPWISVESCDLLKEGNPIPSEPPVGHWREEYKYFQEGARIEAAFRNYFHRASPEQKEDSYEIIVCHANVIRYFLCRLLQLPPEAWLRFSILHCSITKATIEPDGNVIVSSIGDYGFIPADKMTSK